MGSCYPQGIVLSLGRVQRDLALAASRVSSVVSARLPIYYEMWGPLYLITLRGSGRDPYQIVKVLCVSFWMRVRGPFNVLSSQHPSPVLGSSGLTAVGVAVPKEWDLLSPITLGVSLPFYDLPKLEWKKTRTHTCHWWPFSKGYVPRNAYVSTSSACFGGQCGWAGRRAVASVSSDRSHWGLLCQLPDFYLSLNSS